MARCTRTKNLTVHRRRPNEDNDLGNAEVLCAECHAAISVPANGWPPFSEKTIETAIRLAGNRCECTRHGDCH